MLTRRELLTLGITGTALLASPGLLEAAPLCILRPRQTEGPYFVDELLRRSDIRSDPSTGLIKTGTPLDLTFNVMQLVSGRCRQLPNAQVDVWHCDATGVYSDVRDPSFNTLGQRFLRGYQVTNESGIASFRTIYPGWYEGRTVHIHFKIRHAVARNQDFTSQIYFDDALTDRVHRAAFYAKSGTRTRNGGDDIFLAGGRELILRVEPQGNGYAGTFNVALKGTES
jgi:protocatechuate 3,4-dioxygenase beta subunit